MTNLNWSISLVAALRPLGFVRVGEHRVSLRTRKVRGWLACLLALVAAFGMAVAVGGSAHAASTPTLDLNVLLIGNGSTDPTTAAWQSALSAQGVPYTRHPD